MSKKLRKKRKENTINKNDYIDNKEFTKMVCEWVNSLDRERLDNDPEYKQSVRIPDEIVESFIKIGKNLLTNHRFFNYPEDVKEDFLQLGLFKCVKYATNFNPKKMEEEGKTPNAFSYYTQLMYYAFLHSLNEYYKHHNQCIDIKESAEELFKIYGENEDFSEFIKKSIIK